MPSSSDPTAPQSLETTDARLRAVFQTAGIGIALVSAEGVLLDVNPAIERMLGYPKDELVGRTFGEVTHPADLGRSWERFKELVQGERPYFQAHKRYIRKDGSEMWGRLTVSVWHEGDHQTTRCLSVLEDITEWKEAEAMRDRLQAVVEATPDLVGIGDAKGNVLYHNAGGWRMLGLDPQDPPASHRVEDSHPPWAAKMVFEEGFPAALRDGVWEGETAVRNTNGEEIPASQILLAHKDAQGEAAYYSTIIRDISRLKQAEKAARDSERRYRLLVEALGEGVVIIDEDMYVTYVNDPFCALTGYARQDLLGRWAPGLIPEAGHRADAEARFLKLAEGIAERGEWKLRRADGEHRWVLVSGQPLLDDDGQFQGSLSVVADITERKEAEAARLAQRDALVREVHHRIKNNLQGVVGLLSRRADREPEVAELLKPALAQINSIAQVHGLQCRGEGPAAFQLDDLICRIVGQLRQLMALTVEPLVHTTHRCTVVIEPTDAVPLALILNELLVNAAKHGRGGVSVEMAAEDEAEWVEVTVHSADGRLPAGFDYAGGQGVGEGLGLVKSLMPGDGAELAIHQTAEGVTAALMLQPPVVRITR